MKNCCNKKKIQNMECNCEDMLFSGDLCNNENDRETSHNQMTAHMCTPYLW